MAHGRVAVYAGDSHCAWAGRLLSESGAHVALEFDGTSVTSPGLDHSLGYLPPELVAAGYVGATPTLEYAETATRGWLHVTLTREEHRVTFRTVSTVGSTSFTAACDAAFLQTASAPDALVRVPCPEDRETRGEGSSPGASTMGSSLISALLGSLATFACTGLWIAHSRRASAIKHRRMHEHAVTQLQEISSTPSGAAA